MEKPQHPFDDFLKESLKGHQLVPGEQARKALLEEAATISPAHKSWYRWYYLPVLFVVISGIVTLFIYQGNNKDFPGEIIQKDNSISLHDNPSQTNPESLPIIKETDIQIASDRNSENKIAQTGSFQHEINNEVRETESSAENAGNFQQIETHLPGKIETGLNSEPEETFNPDESIPIESPVPESFAGDTDLSQTEPVPVLAFDTVTGTNPVPASKAVTDTASNNILSEPEKQNNGNLQAEKTYASAIYYLPEWMFNTVEGGKFVNNFGVDFVFFLGRTSITTGAGISVSKGISEKSVEYNEFLGTYNKLDSITFTFNESISDFLPEIHTSTENVWDSLSLYDSTEIIKRYTYLQIPLILGLDFWERRRMTVGIRVGTIMSVMLKSNQLTGQYSPGENQVIGINKISPDQVSVNWQAVGGINSSFLLTKRLYLNIEPQVRYYYQSIYEKSGYSKKPWSVGLKTALLFKF